MCTHVCVCLCVRVHVRVLRISKDWLCDKEPFAHTDGLAIKAVMETLPFSNEPFVVTMHTSTAKNDRA